MAPSQTPLTKVQYETITRRLLQTLSYNPPVAPKDPALEKFVSEHFTNLVHLQGLDIEKIPKIAEIAVGMALLLFPLHERDLQKLISLYLGYFLIVDDHAPTLIEHLRNFQRNLILSKPQPPILNGWLQLLAQLGQHYGPFSADMLYAGTLEFITATVFEYESDGHLECTPSAPNFPLYLRIKTGVSEPFVRMMIPEHNFPEKLYLNHYLQAAPDLLEFTGVVNDIFSFYKESVVSTERNNYVYNYAAAHGVGVYQALEAIADRLIECIGNLQEVLASEPEILRYVNSFLQGAIALHALPRYRLDECDIPALVRREQGA